jgi:hypothetical protein
MPEFFSVKARTTIPVGWGNYGGILEFECSAIR